MLEKYDIILCIIDYPKNYPRVYGEKAVNAISLAASLGSPPRMRGED